MNQESIPAHPSDSVFRGQTFESSPLSNEDVVESLPFEAPLSSTSAVFVNDLAESQGVDADCGTVFYRPTSSVPPSRSSTSESVISAASFYTSASFNNTRANTPKLLFNPVAGPSSFAHIDAPIEHTAPPIPRDLADAVRGLYRVLDLVSEEGSGGLGASFCSKLIQMQFSCSIAVDKVIIDQESFGRFVNDICPGAYSSMTKVDFTALDQVQIKPVGIYGSRSEIVNFLLSMDAVDEQM
jgi:hypothetical protein